MYFYFVGSRNLLTEMTNESVLQYKQDQQVPMQKALCKGIMQVGKNRPRAFKNN